MDLIILFSESVVGAHSMDDTNSEMYEVIPLTFPPRVEKISEDEYVFKNNLSNNKDFRKGCDLYFSHKTNHKNKNVSILVGFDKDDMGHSMSEALRENLIREGVLPEDIYRTPLTEAGYILIQDFIDTQEIKKYKYIEQEFPPFLRRNGIINSVGIIKALSLGYAMIGNKFEIDLSKETDEINTSGTSTATVVYKDMIKEL